jgi:TolB-like protein/DNA-binding winged helix-turn-helix (wHTH) protein/tetratricopeptide (TPR) repeat protein
MIYRFDGYEVDTERYELRFGGTVQGVEPLVFDLILFLVRNANRVISRDEVVEHVWDGRVVSEATISSCIKSARKALGDSGESQSRIRTVRGRGFEFRAAVSLSDSEGPAGPGRPPYGGAGTATSQARRAGPLDAKPVIAVLPFTNLSADVEEYFADGLTEDIITNLSRFRDLRVIAGASTFQFKGRAFDLSELCARLKADYVVQGSVRRAAGRVRISAQLIEGSTGVQLFGDRYDREMGDIFELQDEVTRTIAATLGVKMQDVALQRSLTKSPLELDAYDCLLRARRYTWMLSADMHAEARDLLEKAVELNPLSADAHALLANVYLGEHRFEMNPRPNPIGRALVHALAATRLDPQNAYARCWLAIVHFFRGENDRFESESQLAVSLNPNDPETLADVGHYLAFMGEFERGVELSRRAQQLNPLHPSWYYFSFARLHYSQKAYEEVIADTEKVGLPHFYWTHLLRAAALGQLGRAEAPDSLARIFEIKPTFSARGELRKWNAAPDDLEHILEGLRKAGLGE